MILELTGLAAEKRAAEAKAKPKAKKRPKSQATPNKRQKTEEAESVFAKLEKGEQEQDELQEEVDSGVSQDDDDNGQHGQQMAE